ncbi:MAG: hypothetical protein GY758_14130 [Fuerstiella sp.]|nr:hypothetical protein [Fuerstiella sp.]
MLLQSSGPLETNRLHVDAQPLRTNNANSVAWMHAVLPGVLNLLLTADMLLPSVVNSFGH